MRFKSFIWLLILALIIIGAERATVILEEDEHFRDTVVIPQLREEELELD